MAKAKVAAEVAKNEDGKKVVQYVVTPYTYIVVGESAVVVPVDHPDTEAVVNGMTALTSEVVSYNTDTGEFETKNTRYVVAKPVAKQKETVVQ